MTRKEELIELLSSSGKMDRFHAELFVKAIDEYISLAKEKIRIIEDMRASAEKTFGEKTGELVEVLPKFLEEAAAEHYKNKSVKL
jgi:hypothetical protein